MNKLNLDVTQKSDKKITGQLLKFFIIGAIFGQMLFYGLLHNVDDSSAWVKIVASPVYLVRYIYIPLDWLCSTTNSDQCIGLGFDGGPLEWVEWATMYTAMAIAYGLVFVIIYKIYRSLTKQRMDPVDQVK